MDAQEYVHMYEQERDHWWYVGMRAVALSLLPPCRLQGNARVLDAGCGTGYTIGWCRRQYSARVAGVDYCPHALKLCGRRGERDAVRGDVKELPFKNGSFDLVVSFDVLSEIPDAGSRSLALTEFQRILKPGGALLIRVAAYRWLRSSHDSAVSTHHRYGAGELRTAVRNAGFEILRCTYANTALFPAAAVWRLLKIAGLARQGSDVRSRTRGPRWLNRTLLSFLELEAALLRHTRLRLPFGLSIFLVATTGAAPR